MEILAIGLLVMAAFLFVTLKFRYGYLSIELVVLIAIAIGWLFS